MSFNFKQVAQEKVSLCSIMVGRNKLDTDEILNADLTIVAFDFAPKFDKTGRPVVDPDTGEADTFGVVVFKEHPECYYCVGTVFTKICRAWAEPFETPEDASAELAAQGGVRVRFTPSKTKNGNNLTAVEILD